MPLLVPSSYSRDPKCNRCSRFLSANYVCIFATPDNLSSADIMIVADYPGMVEDKRGEALIGDSGRNFKRLLASEEEFAKRKIVYTNAVKCFSKDKPSASDIKACRIHLVAEILRFQPKLIIACGSIAVKAVLGQTGVGASRGTIHDDVVLKDGKLITEAFSAVAMFNPVNLIRSFDNDLSIDETDYLSAFVEDVNMIVDWLKSGVKPKVDLGSYHVITTEKEAVEMLKEVGAQKWVAEDIETNNLIEEGKDSSGPFFDGANRVCLSFSWKHKEAWCLPLWHPDCDLANSKIIRKAVREVEQGPVWKIGHLFVFDALYTLVTEKYRIKNIKFDTGLSSHTLRMGWKTHALKYLARLLLGMGNYDVGLWKIFHKLPKEKRTFANIPLNVLAPYACADADSTRRLWKRDMKTFKKEPELWAVFKGIAMEAFKTVHDMAFRGIRIDTKMLHKLEGRFAKRIWKLETKILKNSDVRKVERMTGKGFNIDSTHDVRKLYFTVQKRETIKLTEGRVPSVDEEVLQLLARKGDKTAARILKLRHLRKLQSSYVEGIRYRLYKGILHPSYSITGTATARFSNWIQTLPANDGIRNLIIPRDGFIFYVFDYNQIELRYLCNLARDSVMKEMFDKFGDMHAGTAAAVFAVNEVEDWQRKAGKTTNFLNAYGGGKHKLGQQFKKVGVTQVQVKKALRQLGEETKWNEDPYITLAGAIIRQFDIKFHRIRKWERKAHRFSRRHGYIITPFGRKRFLPDSQSDDDGVKARGDRKAQNTPPQSGASDTTVIAMNAVRKFLKKHTNNGGLLLNVHDELVVELPDNAETEDVARRIVKIMQTAAQEWLGKKFFYVPLVVSVERGYNYEDDLKKVEL